MEIRCPAKETKSVVDTGLHCWLLAGWWTMMLTYVKPPSPQPHHSQHTKKVLYQILPWLGFQGNIRLFVSSLAVAGLDGASNYSF